MKEVDSLFKKVSEIEKQLALYCADVDLDAPVFESEDKQTEQIKKWLQSGADCIKRISHLKTSISRTNLATQITIELMGKPVTKSITEWIYRRGNGRSMASGLAAIEANLWKSLTDSPNGKQLTSGQMHRPDGSIREVKVRRYYNPQQRELKISELQVEPSKIDGALEVANAITDLIES